MIKYMQSKVLNLPVKYNTNTGRVTVKDLKKFGSRGYIEYSRNEIRLLNKLGGIAPEIHLLKSVFDGVIVKIEKSGHALV